MVKKKSSTWNAKINKKLNLVYLKEQLKNKSAKKLDTFKSK
jgi:hypothetical protein